MKLRSDHRAAVMMKNRSHHESGESFEEPIHPSQQRRIQQGQEVFLRRLLLQRSSWPTYRMAILAFISKFFMVVRIRMELEVRLLFLLSFSLQLVSFTVDGDPLLPTGCVDRVNSHETFSRHFHPCAHITLWLKVSHDVSA